MQRQFGKMMDVSSQALGKVREEVMASRAWSKLQKELIAQIRHMEYSTREVQLRTFQSLSAREKRAALDRAVKEAGTTPAYAKLQTEVATAVDRHFSPLLFQLSNTQHDRSTSSSSVAVHSPGRAPSRTHHHPLAEACSRLLQESPHLKHSLKNALNHPLSPRLRLQAWKSLLHYPAVERDFLVRGKEMQPRSDAEREITERCRSVLKSNALFGDVAERPSALQAMWSVMLYWKQRAGGDILDSELLLCVPFIHVWREELERHVGEGKGEGWLLFAEIVGEYVQFMEILPPGINSATSSGESEDGMNKFSRCVEELLQREDPQLYKALQKLLKKAAGGSSFKSTHRENKDAHKSLKSILLPHIQKMFVGDLSMDVLCYIWDQCFMGLDVPEYQCLPYFTTVWLILLRDRLLKDTSIEAVEEALSVHSASLLTIQFQKEIEKRFIVQLSSLLRVKPIPLQIPSRPRVSLPHLSHPHPSHLSHPHPSHLSHPHPSNLSHPHPSHRPLSQPSHLLHAHPQHSYTRGGRGQSARHSSANSGKINFQQRMEDMQEEIEREQRILSHRIREEREQQQRQLELFRTELREIKMGLGREWKKCQSADRDKSLRSLLQAPVKSSSTQPTLLLVEASQSTGSKSGKSPDVKVIPVQLSPQQPAAANEARRPFSPTNLSESDVQTLWLKVLQRFTAAAYTICHGTGSERQKLFSTLHPSTDSES